MTDFDPRLLTVTEKLCRIRAERRPGKTVSTAEAMEDITVVLAAFAEQPISQGMLVAANDAMRDRPVTGPARFSTLEAGLQAALRRAVAELGS